MLAPAHFENVYVLGPHVVCDESRLSTLPKAAEGTILTLSDFTLLPATCRHRETEKETDFDRICIATSNHVKSIKTSQHKPKPIVHARVFFGVQARVLVFIAGSS